MKKEKIPGGLSKGKSLKDIAVMHCDKKTDNFHSEVEKLHDKLKLELKKGVKVELEHTDDKTIAREIAMDHLYEDPKYYTKLAKIEEMRQPKKISISQLSEIIKRTVNEEMGGKPNMPHTDHEATMAKAEIRDMVKNAKEIYKLIKEGDQLPGWISAYITLASDYMHSIAEYMIEKNSDGEELDEESQKF